MLFALKHSFFLIAILSIECCCFSNCLILFLFAVYWCECSCYEWRGGTQSIPFSNLMLSLKHFWLFIDIQGTSVLSFDFFFFFLNGLSPLTVLSDINVALKILQCSLKLSNTGDSLDAYRCDCRKTCLTRSKFWWWENSTCVENPPTWEKNPLATACFGLWYCFCCIQMHPQASSPASNIIYFE